jgi:hypothetical protein
MHHSRQYQLYINYRYLLEQSKQRFSFYLIYCSLFQRDGQVAMADLNGDLRNIKYFGKHSKHILLLTANIVLNLLVRKMNNNFNLNKTI